MSRRFLGSVGGGGGGSDGAFNGGNQHHPHHNHHSQHHSQSHIMNGNGDANVTSGLLSSSSSICRSCGGTSAYGDENVSISSSGSSHPCNNNHSRNHSMSSGGGHRNTNTGVLSHDNSGDKSTSSSGWMRSLGVFAAGVCVGLAIWQMFMAIITMRYLHSVETNLVIDGKNGLDDDHSLTGSDGSNGIGPLRNGHTPVYPGRRGGLKRINKNDDYDVDDHPDDSSNNGDKDAENKEDKNKKPSSSPNNDPTNANNTIRRPPIIFKPIYFDEIAGMDEAKYELVELVKFLRSPQKYKNVGARMPKGVLLVGPPGTGKTMLARAVATEADVPYLYASGSEFVEIFVGQGACRIRSLFAHAREKSPCIIFIDEIDTVGGKRSNNGGISSNREHDQTLNQLLVELDGFSRSSGIIVLAATNRIDTLDKALLRPGRFDRLVSVHLPDVRGRELILKKYLNQVPHNEEEVDVHRIAQITPGFSGADLENLVNEAALLAARHEREIVTWKELQEARDKVSMGPERRSLVMSDFQKKLTAYHEAGHAMVAFFLQPNSDPIHKATIVSRGSTLGFVEQVPPEDRYGMGKAQLEARLAVAMGGRCAEMIVFGKEKMSNGASSDIVMATNTAWMMVAEWGMSDRLGPLNYSSLIAASDGSKLGGRGGNGGGSIFGGGGRLSGSTASELEKEVKKIVSKAEITAQGVLRKHRKKLDELATALLEHETLGGEQISNIIDPTGYHRQKLGVPMVSSIPDDLDPSKGRQSAASALASPKWASKASFLSLSENSIIRNLVSLLPRRMFGWLPWGGGKSGDDSAKGGSEGVKGSSGAAKSGSDGAKGVSDDAKSGGDSKKGSSDSKKGSNDSKKGSSDSTKGISDGAKSSDGGKDGARSSADADSNSGMKTYGGGLVSVGDGEGEKRKDADGRSDSGVGRGDGSGGKVEREDIDRKQADERVGHGANDLHGRGSAGKMEKEVSNLSEGDSDKANKKTGSRLSKGEELKTAEGKKSYGKGASRGSANVSGGRSGSNSGDTGRKSKSSNLGVLTPDFPEKQPPLHGSEGLAIQDDFLPQDGGKGGKFPVVDNRKLDADKCFAIDGVINCENPIFEHGRSSGPESSGGWGHEQNIDGGGADETDQTYSDPHFFRNSEENHYSCDYDSDDSFMTIFNDRGQNDGVVAGGDYDSTDSSSGEGGRDQHFVSHDSGRPNKNEDDLSHEGIGGGDAVEIDNLDRSQQGQKHLSNEGHVSSSTALSSTAALSSSNATLDDKNVGNYGAKREASGSGKNRAILKNVLPVSL